MGKQRQVVKAIKIVGVTALSTIVLFAMVGLAVSCGGDTTTSAQPPDGGLGGSLPYGDSEDVVARDEPADPQAAKELDAGTASVSSELPYGPDALDPARYLIRTGDMTVHVDEGDVPDVAARVAALAAGYNGYVVSSQITMSGEDTRPYATITVKVPSRSYDQAIARFSELGEVAALHTGTEDATGQVVDVKARLKHYRAVERRLLSFLSKATTIGEALSIQERIDATQLQVEELAAQLKALRNQTTYGTLTVAVTEPPEDHVADDKDDDSFASALADSWRLIVNGFGAIVVGFGAVLPFIVLLAIVIAVVWYGSRLVLRIHNRHMTHAV